MERSPEQPEGYVLRGGQAGAARLRLINRVKWLLLGIRLNRGNVSPHRYEPPVQDHLVGQTGTNAHAFLGRITHTQQALT